MVALLGEYVGKPGVMVMPVRARAAEVAEGLSEAMGAGFVAPDADASELDELSGATVVLVDDGFDSTERLREAAMVARGCGAVRVVAAGPVGTTEACHRIARIVDRCVCLATPTPFHSVAFWYDDSFRAGARAIFAGTSRNSPRREFAIG
jgi:hypothetical protein